MTIENIGIINADLKKTESEINYHDSETLSSAELTEIWANRASKLAQKPKTKNDGETIDLLIFRLGKERYGIDVLNVREIYPLEQLTPVPRTPNFVAGVFSARGRILSVIDLHAFFGLPAGSYDENSLIIVINNTNPTSETADMELGILTNQVEDVRSILQDKIDTAFTRRHTTTYTEGITSDLLEVLNMNTLLEDKRLIINDELA